MGNDGFDGNLPSRGAPLPLSLIGWEGSRARLVFGTANADEVRSPIRAKLSNFIVTECSRIKRMSENRGLGLKIFFAGIHQRTIYTL